MQCLLGSYLIDHNVKVFQSGYSCCDWSVWWALILISSVAHAHTPSCLGSLVHSYTNFPISNQEMHVSTLTE